MTEAEFMKEYVGIGHAIQTGILLELEHENQTAQNMFKHLRTGLNLVMSDHGSLGRLLVKKGLITQEEYFTTVLEGLKTELESLEKKLSERFGHEVHLG